MSSAFTFTHSLEADVSAESVWALYADTATWPLWDAEAESVTRDGPFAAGTTGTMTCRGQEPLSYRLTTVEPLREFVDETPVGATVVRVSHRLEPLPGGRLRLTYEARIDGPDAGTLGPAVTADFPDTMRALVALAGGRSA
jgi:Polyketide cyclase / dehydrase and lipid transport